MVYNGLGQRLTMTGYAEGLGTTTRYLLDTLRDARPVLAETDGQVVSYVYGLNLIGEAKEGWSFYLYDGLNSVRQVSDPQGAIRLASSFTPWGDLLELSGEGDLGYGYLGGMLDAATGLIYLGGGQYYDPSSGRFLTRDLQPNRANPYVPWNGDPFGSMMGPLALLILLRLRKRKKNGEIDRILLAALLLLAIGMAGMSLAACTAPTQPPSTTPPATPPGGTGTPEPSPTSNPRPTSTPEPPSKTPTPPQTCTDTQTSSSQKEIIFFGGSYLGDLNRIGPDPASVTWVWADIATISVRYPGGGDLGKANQADSINISAYENASIILIGYSAGADSALMFADKYYRWQKLNSENGKRTTGMITDIAVLGGTFSGRMPEGNNGSRGNLDIEYFRVLNELLEWGTDIYILDDKAAYGKPIGYSAPIDAKGTYHLEQRPEQEHWDGATRGQVGIGTNNSEAFREELFAWFENH